MHLQEHEPIREGHARSRFWWIACLTVLAGLVLAVGGFLLQRSGSNGHVNTGAMNQPGSAHYVGAARCASCHQSEFASWNGSQHRLAMQTATPQSVLGNFDHTTYKYAEVTSTFFRRGEQYLVTTDGPDGHLHDYPIQYTFGVAPLQQYLIALPGGRLQALSIAWDSRPAEQGGQRWFHLYPGQGIKAGDRLHWTGIDQNWNYQCADCHSTHLLKQFDEPNNTFHTTWSDINVACEACHGAGSRHLAWATKQGDWQHIANKGLSAMLDERHGVSWNRTADLATAVRSVPRASDREVDTCAHCHARRGQLSDDYHAGHPLADSYRPALLQEGLYWPDGQMRGEVYNYASFLQSKMYAHGVTCSDCHEPHGLQLRAPGNLVCAQCHDSARFDSVSHSHHAPGSSGAQCAACHMPTTTYMQIDPRHDHSLRIPRPDRTVSMGTPNACNQCHSNRSAQWAMSQIRTWHPLPAAGHQSFAEALDAGTRATAEARSMLLGVAADLKQPAVARATAIGMLASYPGPRTTDVLHTTLTDADPLVRDAAVEALANESPQEKLRWLLRLAADPVQLVRIDVAQALNGVPLEGSSDEERGALGRASGEYLAAQQFNADRPEAHANLGLYYATAGQRDKGEAELKKALAIDPGFTPAAVNLADLYRSGGDESRAESTLRTALQKNPGDAASHYALGLSLARQQRLPDAMAQLAQATHLAPEERHYAYVYGVALHSTGKIDQGIRALAESHKKFPGDLEILQALATMERDRGHLAEARAYAQQLVALVPDDPQAQALLRNFER